MQLFGFFVGWWHFIIVAPIAVWATVFNTALVLALGLGTYDFFHPLPTCELADSLHEREEKIDEVFEDWGSWFDLDESRLDVARTRIFEQAIVAARVCHRERDERKSQPVRVLCGKLFRLSRPKFALMTPG